MKRRLNCDAAAPRKTRDRPQARRGARIMVKYAHKIKEVHHGSDDNNKKDA